MAAIKNAIVVESLRSESFSRMVAKALIAVVPKSLILEILEISQLPMYRQDLEPKSQLAWTDFRSRLKSFDAVIFVTPEYQRSFSGVPKSGSVVSIAIRAIGGFGASYCLRQSLVFINTPMMPNSETYMSDSQMCFETNGNLSNDSTHAFLTKFMTAFSKSVEKNKNEEELS